VPVPGWQRFRGALARQRHWPARLLADDLTVPGIFSGNRDRAAMRELLLYGSILFATLMMLQTWLLARKMRSRWALGVVILLLAIPYDVVTSQHGYAVSGLVSLAISIQAFVRWQDDEP
jgi:hypothetical protein